jgi:hypothetical protein
MEVTCHSAICHSIRTECDSKIIGYVFGRNSLVVEVKHDGVLIQHLTDTSWTVSSPMRSKTDFPGPVRVQNRVDLVKLLMSAIHGTSWFDGRLCDQAIDIQ